MTRHRKRTITLIAIGALILVVIYIALFLALTGRIEAAFESFTLGDGVRGITVKNIEQLDGEYTEQGKYTLELNSVSKIDIQWIDGQVEVIQGESDEIVITEYAKRDLKESEIVAYRQNGDTLDIRVTDTFFGTQFKTIEFLPEKKVVVEVPSALKENGEIIIDNTSGSIMVRDLLAAKCNLESYSGKIETSNLTVNSIHLDTTSGSIVADGVKTKDLSAEAYSGSVKLDNIESESTSLSTTSGKVDVSELVGEKLSVEAYDGNVTISNLTTEKINIDATSSAVTVDTASAEKISVSSYSGEIILGGLKCDELDIENTSGKISDKNSIVTHCSLSTYSGDINFDGEYKRISAESTSGSLAVTSSVCPNKFDAEIYSGDILLIVPQTDGVEVNFESASGKLTYDGITLAKNSDEYVFNVETTSGSFEIRNK